MAWLFGVAILISGVALIAFHVQNLPYTWNSVGLGIYTGLIGFFILLAATAYIAQSA
jgi:hypothetical protein